MINLHGEALSAAAGTACVRVHKVEPLTVQAVREIEDGPCQVQYAFLIYYDPDALVLEDHVIRPGLRIEFKIIHQARTASSNYAYPYVVIVGMPFLFAQCKDLSLGSFGYCYHPDNYLKLRYVYKELSAVSSQLSAFSPADNYQDQTG